MSDKDRIAELEAALREAREDFDEFEMYADDYFRGEADAEESVMAAKKRIDAVLNKEQKG